MDDLAIAIRNKGEDFMIRVNNLSYQVNRVADHSTPNGMMLVMAIL